eukprot:181349_1
MTTSKIISLNDYYLIACYQCRCFGGLQLYNKSANEIFHVISSYAFPPNFEFVTNHPVFQVTDDGLSVIMEDKSKYGTIRFGEFLTSEDKLIYRATFQMDTYQSANFCGTGFVKHEFDEWSSSSWNQGNNHSIMPYCSGGTYAVCNKGEFKNVICDSRTAKYFFLNGNKITYEMNMITMKATIWDSTRFNKDQPYFSMDLCDNIAIGFCMGSDNTATKQKVTLVNQEFLFNIQV